jgi:hypothetical protein
MSKIVYNVVFTSYLDDYKARGENWSTVEDTFTFDTDELANDFIDEYLKLKLEAAVECWELLNNEQVTGSEKYLMEFIDKNGKLDISENGKSVQDIAKSYYEISAEYVHTRFTWKIISSPIITTNVEYSDLVKEIKDIRSDQWDHL